MSNVPSGGWSPPPPAGNWSPEVVKAGPASLNWRIQHSLWLLLPILGCSCLGGFGLVYVGLRARRPAWWIPGIVYAVVGWSLFALVGELDKDHAASEWVTVGVLAVWIACIVHAALVNSSWLRWRANHRPWYAQPSTTAAWAGASPHPTPHSPPPSTYYGPGPVAAPVPQPTQPVTQQVPPVVAPTATVDINTARLDQLATLPGFDITRAGNVLAERARRGSFGSVAEFVSAANMAPHEYARLRDVLICAPPATHGPHGGQSPHGRVVDV